MAGGYNATKGGRLRKSRSSLGGSADDQISSSDLWKIREACRDLLRNNPLAAGLIQTMVDNIIGVGHTPQAKTDDTTWNDLAEDYWAKTRLDYRGVLTNREVQRVYFRSVLRDGDMGCQLIGGRLQGIEGDRIDTPMDRATKGNVFMGVETNAVGTPVRYWIGKRTGAYGVVDAQPISASDFLHLYRPERLSQTRGVPIEGPIIDTLDRIDDTAEAVIIAHQLAACQGLLIQKEYQDDLSFSNVESEENAATGDSEYWEEMEPGMIQYLKPGESMNQVKPEHPGQRFGEMIRELGRFTGRHMGLPIELILLDFSESNFSNTRMAVLEARQAFKGWQQWWQEAFLQPVWQYRISWAMKHGKLPPAPDGQAWNVEWHAPGWPWVDPLKDVQADVLAMRNNITPRSAICAKYGFHWADVDRQREEERKAEPQGAEAGPPNKPSIRS